jgi:putative transposase
VGFALLRLKVIRTLNQICCDYGLELMSWAKQQGIRIEYIQPGKLQQNTDIEWLNRTARYRWVSQYLLDPLAAVQDDVIQWLGFDNHARLHKANGGKSSLMTT